MSEKTLDALLRIVIEGPSVEEYPITEAVTLWVKKKNRRLSTQTSFVISLISECKFKL